MASVSLPVGAPAGRAPPLNAPDVFLHKAPNWVRYAPNPSLGAIQQPHQHVNRHLDAPVLDSFRPKPLHARLRFHPALYPQALERLRSKMLAVLQEPGDAALRQRLDAHLRMRVEHIRAYRREAQKLLAC